MYQDKDGDISAEEYLRILAFYNMTYTTDEVNAILRMADENKDGIVDFIGKSSINLFMKINLFVEFILKFTANTI